jgi:hypothetical protein
MKGFVKLRRGWNFHSGDLLLREKVRGMESGHGIMSHVGLSRPLPRMIQSILPLINNHHGWRGAWNTYFSGQGLDVSLVGAKITNRCRQKEPG